MEENFLTKAQELVKAVKDNLLKPMYSGLKNNTDSVRSDLLDKIDTLENKIEILTKQQDAFIEAIKNIKWDDNE